MLFVCHSYVVHMNSYVTRISFVCRSYVLVSVCHSYILVCHSYVTCMYWYVTRMSLVFTRMYSHPYVSRLWFYHEPFER